MKRTNPNAPGARRDVCTITAKRRTLANALRVAAVQYGIDANSGHPQRLADGFLRQAEEANKLAELIDESDLIDLED